MNNITDLTGEDGPDPEEQQMRIAQVLSTIESICATDTDKANTADDNQSATDTLDEEPGNRTHAGTTLLRPVSATEAEQMLKAVGWDVEQAVIELTEAQEEEARLLDRRVLPPTTVPPENYQGMENVGNTCYLDSVLMAMFGTLTTFDSLLTRDMEDPRIRGLQHELLTVVNRLRNGRLVTKEQMKRLLDVLHTLNWPTADGERNSYGQQDASELLITLLDRLGGPLLPMEYRMVHGAMDSSGDETLVKESILQVSVASVDGDNSCDRPTKLVDVLENHYFGEDVVDIEREVECDKMGDPIKRTKVKALRTLHSLPFYDSQSVQCNSQHPQSTQNIIIPICFKRYSNAGGIPRRLDRRVEIPTSLDFSQFVSAESMPPQTYTLELMSLVCHQGQQMSSGHYRAYIRTLDDEWLLFDDLATPRVKRLSLLESTFAMAEEWQRDTYIALFALNHKPILNRDETVRKSPSIVRDYPQSQRSSDCSDNMTCSDTFASKGRSVIRNAVVHKGSCHSMSTHKIGSTIEDRKGCSSSGTDTIVNSDEARSSSLSRSSNTTTHMTRKNVVSENSSSMGGSSTHPTDNAVVDSTGGNRITLYATKLRPESSSCLRGSNAKRRKRDTPVTLSSSIRTGLTCKDRDSTATSSDGSELPPIAGNVAVGVHTDTHRESECTAQVEDADEQSNHSRSTTPLTRGREVPIQHSGCGLVQAFQEVAVYPCDSSNVARALHNTVVNSGLGFSGGVGWGVWNSICGRSMGVGIGVSPTDTGMDSEARATKNINVPTEPATPSRLWG